MYILIEGHQYKEQTELVSELLSVIQDPIERKKGLVNYVGYFYNTKEKIKDCVFVLPKVLLSGEKSDEERVFGKYMPEEIINLKPDGDNPLSQNERSFIYELAVWIYKAIDIFEKTHGDSIVYRQHVVQAGKGFRHKTNTLLDIILELRRFNRENQNFFFTTLRNLHSGYNKINWTRTISKTTAIVQDNTPIYLRPVNKKRQINFDEELLVIFFSILNHINEVYGFKEQINCNFDLVTGKMFETYLNGMGRTRLRQIKYKYFSDKALELWELCYAFFDYAYQVRIHIDRKEYLIVKNFNIVFEAIIDELIGDKDHPHGLKEQEDGKRVDHLYTYKELTSHDENRDIYYIGDSKYYKSSTKIQGPAFYKQFTYARNVIQWHLNLFGDREEIDEGDLTDEDKSKNAKDRAKYQKVNLRDEITEGYNIIPNFFISAKMDKDFDYSNPNLEIEKESGATKDVGRMYMQTHFYNRIFDRDTLLLFHYNVNFLYVLSLYARNNTQQKANWKEKVREQFRREIQKSLNDKFDFYAMRALPDVNIETYIKEHFQEVLGKMYAPYSAPSSSGQIFSLALDKKDENNDKLLAELRNHFYVENCKLGEKLDSKLPKVAEVSAQPTSIEAGSRVLIGVITSRDKELEKKLIEKFSSKQADIYYTGEEFPSSYSLKELSYFIPYIKGKGVRDLYRIKDISTITYTEIKNRLLTAGERKLLNEKPKSKGNESIRIGFEVEFVKTLADDYKSTGNLTYGEALGKATLDRKPDGNIGVMYNGNFIL